jgi:hypothetical protein
MNENKIKGRKINKKFTTLRKTDVENYEKCFRGNKMEDK